MHAAKASEGRRPAVFLDRDGVLIEDVDLMTRPDQVRLLDGVAAAIAAIQSLDLAVIVVTNQAVVARGLCSEDDVRAVHTHIEKELVSLGAARPDGFYFCPHHPHANIEAYRTQCECRKPSPGMLSQAALEHHIDLANSFMIGDRPTDVLAGHRASCTTILLRTGLEEAPLIVGASRAELVPADHTCDSLLDAVRIIEAHHHRSPAP